MCQIGVSNLTHISLHGFIELDVAKRHIVAPQPDRPRRIQKLNSAP